MASLNKLAWHVIDLMLVAFGIIVLIAFAPMFMLASAMAGTLK